jgi:hypothetical protein
MEVREGGGEEDVAVECESDGGFDDAIEGI